MSHAPLSAKQASFVQYYADPASLTYNNAHQSAKKAGYSIHSAKQIGTENIAKPSIVAAIATYKAQIAVKLEHDRDAALKLIHQSLDALDKKVALGDVSAIAARTPLIRELNAISNLHKQTIATESKEPELTPAEQSAAEEASKVFKLRLSAG